MVDLVRTLWHSHPSSLCIFNPIHLLLSAIKFLKVDCKVMKEGQNIKSGQPEKGIYTSPSATAAQFAAAAVSQPTQPCTPSVKASNQPARANVFRKCEELLSQVDSLPDVAELCSLVAAGPASSSRWQQTG